MESFNLIEYDLDKINYEIFSHDAKWTAGYNSIFTEDSNLVRYYLGANIDNSNNTKNEVINDLSSLPEFFDWRNFDGKNYITSIKNQRSCGSCVAFAATAVLESVIQIETDFIFDYDLSESHLFFCGGGSCSIGWTNDAAADFIENTGVVDELCFPYSPKNMDCDEKDENWIYRLVRAETTGYVIGIEGIKNALINYGPLLTSYYVYEDFSSYNSGIYEHVWGSIVGGHAVAIVGYDDKGGYWICKNSWGAYWGENGYFRIKYGECSIDNKAFYFDDINGNIQPSKPMITYPEDGANLLDISIELKWDQSIDFEGEEIYYSVYLNEGYSIDFEAQPIASKLQKDNYQIDDLKKDSIYSWQVIAEDENGAKHSEGSFQFSTRKPVLPSINGPSRIKSNEIYTFTVSTSDDHGSDYYWYFDWGDGESTGWIGPYAPGEQVKQGHSWENKGDFEIRVKYKEDEIESDWASLELSMPKSKDYIINLFSMFYEFLSSILLYLKI